MYARSSTFQANRDALEEGIAHLRDVVMPEVMSMDGCIGMSMLVDREGGRCIATTAWDSAEAMHASADRVSPIRDRASEILGGNAEVEEWEIGVVHRDHRSAEGACCRATWIKADPAELERVMDVFKLALLPRIEELDGFCSASLMIDRASGKAVSSVSFDSRSAMEASREQVAAIRESGQRETGAEIYDVCEFDLALAHLHVPEMA